VPPPGHALAADWKQEAVTASQQLRAPVIGGQLVWHSALVVQLDGHTPGPLSWGGVPLSVSPLDPELDEPVSGFSVVPTSGCDSPVSGVVLMTPVSRGMVMLTSAVFLPSATMMIPLPSTTDPSGSITALPCDPPHAATTATANAHANK